MPDNCSLQVPAAGAIAPGDSAQGGVPANSFIVGAPAERIVTKAIRR